MSAHDVDEIEAEQDLKAAALLHEFGVDALPEPADLAERHGSGQGLVKRTPLAADRLKAALTFTASIQSLPDPVEVWRTEFGVPPVELGIDPPSIGLA